MTDWLDLESRSRALLDSARVVLEGPVTTYDGSTRGAPDSRAPTGHGPAILETLAQQLQDAASGEQLLRALHRAELQLWRVRYTRQVSRRSDSPDAVRLRLTRDWIGSAPEEVAEFEPLTVAQVCRLRAEVGRDPLNGRPAEQVTDRRWRTPDERALVVQRLHAAHPHLSARALSMMVGVSHPTVLSDLMRGRAGI